MMKRVASCLIFGGVSIEKWKFCTLGSQFVQGEIIVSKSSSD